MSSSENSEIDISFLFRPITSPVSSSTRKYVKIQPGVSTPSDEIIRFLENRSPIYSFEYSHVKRKNSKISLGYEEKTVDEINAIYLMINPDPQNFALVPANSLVISHHKISCYNNRIYEGMLERAREKKFNIYNFHLAWDCMKNGIGDSFLYHVGLTEDDFYKVDLTYKGYRVHNLGAISKEKYRIEEIVIQLNKMKVNPSVIFNPQCKNALVGYIPGGGFNDHMKWLIMEWMC